MSNSVIKKISKFTKNKEFSYEKVKPKSIAAAAMCEWVCAMDTYAHVVREVEPLKQALAKAQKTLHAKQASLRSILDELKQVEDVLAKLQAQYDASEGEKKRLIEHSEELETKLIRAGQLVEGLQKI